MAVSQNRVVTPAEKRAAVHHGTVVNVRVTKGATHYAMTGESESPLIGRAVSRTITLWVEGRAASDRFRLDMCYYPVFDENDAFDPVASKWAQIGEIVDLAAGNLVAAQTLDDLGYGLRVVRVNNGGAPTAGDFDVYAWALNG